MARPGARSQAQGTLAGRRRQATNEYPRGHRQRRHDRLHYRHHGRHAADQPERRPRAGKNDFKANHMVMMLPFLTAAIALWLALMGKRGACLWLWLLTLIIFAVWCHQHMTGTLPISL